MEQQLDTNEDSLKKEKLLLEIEELRSKKPWKRQNILEKLVPMYFPSLVAIVALSIGVLNGIFDVKTQRLSLQKERLEIDIINFTAEKQKIKRLNDSLMAANQRLQSEVTTAKRYGLSLASKIQKLSKTATKVPCIQSGSYLLTEDGGYLLSEDGNRISIESLYNEADSLKKRIADYTFDQTF